ncbi:MAG: DUF4440 domain-containing protein [Gemmatimonadales bacterium]
MIMLLLLSALLAAPHAPTLAQDSSFRNAALGSLVAAERAFAAMAGSSGTRTAFLANLADDGIVFGPRATNGKAYWRARPNRPSVLAWAPALADVSLDGDLGYTMGPWTFRPARDSAVVASGTFVTLWRRTSAGWRVALDLGISHDSASSWPTKVAFPIAPAARRSAGPAIRDYLRHLDSLGRGTANEATTFLREGHPPTRGHPAAVDRGRLIPEGGAVATSGDLAYTFGAVGSSGRESYLRIWRRERAGHWLVVLDRRG